MAEPTPLVPKKDSDGFQETTINSNFDQISDRLITNIIKDETGTPRLIMGKLPDGTYGLVISKEGVDVTTVFS